MTQMRINLMPKSPKAETIESLRIAQVAAQKLLIYRLRAENKTQHKLIEAYERYFNFMERRYPIEEGLRREDAINGPSIAERKTSQG